MTALDMLNKVPDALKPWFVAVALTVLVIMGIVGALAYNNPGAKEAIKTHLVWLIGCALLVFGGGAALKVVLSQIGAQ